MARTKEELVPILFRYFMAASLMSQEFDKHTYAIRRTALCTVATRPINRKVS
jgi:hypothetical protein